MDYKLPNWGLESLYNQWQSFLDFTFQYLEDDIFRKYDIEK